MERLKLIGKVKPYTKGAKKCEKFGIGLEKLDRDALDPKLAYGRLEELGMKYIRIQSGWQKTEKVPGVYDFAWLDEIVDDLLARDMQPWMCLCYGNSLYTEAAKEYFGAVGCPPVATEREREAWAKYCREVALHFKGRVEQFEIWNEADGAWCWKHGVSAKEYAEFCKSTSKAVREANPGAKLFANYCLWEYGFGWLEEALQNGMGDAIDAVTYHEYTTREEHVFERVNSLRALLARYGDIKVIQGEGGCNSSYLGRGAMRGAALTEEKQAKLLLRRQIVDLMTEVEFSSVFTTVDMAEGINRKDGSDELELDCGYFGLLSCEFDKKTGHSVGEFKPKPSFYAYKTFLGVFGEGAEPCELPIIFLPEYSERLKGFNTRRTELIATGFKKPNGSYAYVYWKPTDLLSTTFDGNASFQAASLPEEVHIVDLMNGNVYDFDENIMQDAGFGIKHFREAPVRDYPLMITFGDFFEIERG